jgi:hypothetical protein
VSETTTPTYAGPDGTYLDVTAPPADAPHAAMLLNVSGCTVGIYPSTADSLLGLLADRAAGAVLETQLGRDSEALLRVEITDTGVQFTVRDGRQETYHVHVPESDIVFRVWRAMAAIWSGVAR